MIYISHKEFFVIESQIMKQLFSDQFSDSTSATLISSPLQFYIVLLLPILTFFSKDGEILSTVMTVGILILYRLISFISIYKLNNVKDFDINGELMEAVNQNNIQKLKNPMPKPVSAENPLSSKKDENIVNANQPEANPIITEGNSPTSYSTLTAVKNSYNKQFVTNKMLNACLVVIALDFIFIFTFALPLCFGISLHHIGSGFTYISLVVIIAYSCDVGALFTGIRFGKTPFGSPITPSKTLEGLYGGILLSVVLSSLFRLGVMAMTKVPMMSLGKFVLFFILEIISSVLGDFFESFLKRCAGIKDSGTIFPGHGGLLDRIDSIVFGLPICYYFIKSTINV